MSTSDSSFLCSQFHVTNKYLNFNPNNFLVSPSQIFANKTPGSNSTNRKYFLFSARVTCKYNKNNSNNKDSTFHFAIFELHSWIMTLLPTALHTFVVLFVAIVLKVCSSAKVGETHSYSCVRGWVCVHVFVCVFVGSFV